MTAISVTTEKLNEVKEEMKRIGLWAGTTPAWVLHYEKKIINNEEAFSEWLQFVYLPNKATAMAEKNEGHEGNYIAPQATKFFGSDTTKGRLLQLLIELDSLL